VTDDFWTTLRAIVKRFDELGIAYMLVGSVAALAHGRSRTTNDVDMVVEVDERKLRAFVASLPSERFYASEQAALDALRRQALFNVIDIETGWKIDVVPRKRRAFSREEFSRRRVLDVSGTALPVASLEDVILSKLEWAKLSGGSARQLEDAEALVRLAGDALDVAYIQRWAKELGVEAEWAVLERNLSAAR
jgi:hypothetical protein